MKLGITKWKKHVVDAHGIARWMGLIECSMAKVNELDQNRANVLVTRESLLYAYFEPDRLAQLSNALVSIYV